MNADMNILKPADYKQLHKGAVLTFLDNRNTTFTGLEIASMLVQFEKVCMMKANGFSNKELSERNNKGEL